MPVYKFPLAVFTTSQTMLLWFHTQQEQFHWKNAFSLIMQRTDKKLVDNFSPPCDPKKVVLAIYEQLKKASKSSFRSDLEKVTRRVHSTATASRRNNDKIGGDQIEAHPVLRKEQDDDSKFDVRGATLNLSNQKPKNNRDSKENDAPTEGQAVNMKSLEKSPVETPLKLMLPPKPKKPVTAATPSHRMKSNLTKIDDQEAKENDVSAAMTDGVSPIERMDRIALNKEKKAEHNADRVLFGTDHSNKAIVQMHREIKADDLPGQSMFSMAAELNNSDSKDVPSAFLQQREDPSP